VLDFLWVCLGAAVGAPARYLVHRAVQRRSQTALPWGTVLVNITGSFAFGVLTGLVDGQGAPSALTLLAGAGFCGAFTTFSTLAYETLRLIETDRWRQALATVAASVAGGLGAALLGYALAGLA
jgi:fluoride exporter